MMETTREIYSFCAEGKMTKNWEVLIEWCIWFHIQIAAKPNNHMSTCFE